MTKKNILCNLRHTPYLIEYFLAKGLSISYGDHAFNLSIQKRRSNADNLKTLIRKPVKEIRIESSSSVLVTSDTSKSLCKSDVESESSVTNDRKTENHTCIADKCLTENLLKQHEQRYSAMTSEQRIDFWYVSDNLLEIEDDLKVEGTQHKPYRSERVSYKKIFKKRDEFLSSCFFTAAIYEQSQLIYVS